MSIKPDDSELTSAPSGMERDLHTYTGIGQPLAWLTRGWRQVIGLIVRPVVWHLKDRKHLWAVRQSANIISTLRIVLAVQLGWWLSVTSSGQVRVWQLTAAVLLALSDGIDGELARELEIESFYGKAMDPLADKVYFGSLGAFLISYLDEPVVTGLVFTMVGLETIILFVGIAVGRRALQLGKEPAGSNVFGKFKFVFECLAVLLGWAIASHTAATDTVVIFVVLAIPCGFLSLGGYLRQLSDLTKLTRTKPH